MKIVVLGGTGLIGAKLVRLLTGRGHHALAASPSTGVDSITGAGLTEALTGADVVVDVTNPPSFADDDALRFFQTSGRNQATAEKGTGVRHHIALSIVGADGLPDSGYMRAKVAQERLIVESGVPYTILRATQFYEFLGAIAAMGAVGDEVRLTPATLQPVAADEVVSALAELAESDPANRVIELAGPAAAPLSELVRRLFEATGDDRKVIADPRARYSGALLDDGSLTPSTGDARLGATTYEQWLATLRG